MRSRTLSGDQFTFEPWLTLHDSWAVLLERSVRLAEAMFPGASGLRKRIGQIRKGPIWTVTPHPFSINLGYIDVGFKAASSFNKTI